MRKAFSAYGFDLKDKDSELKLNIPSSLVRISNFHTPGQEAIKSSNQQDLDAILSQKWSGKLTKSSLGPCADQHMKLKCTISERSLMSGKRSEQETQPTNNE